MGDHSEMKNILLVDTNIASYPIYNVLKFYGFNVYVIGANPLDTLAKASNQYIEADYSDHKVLVNVIKMHNIDQVIPGCNDVSYKVCVEVNELLGFPFKGIETLDNTIRLNEKDAFRKYATELGLSVPRSFINFDEIGQVPVIIKPVDSFSGKGITVIEKPKRDTIIKAITKAKRYSKADRIVIEEFVKGPLYSHTAFIENQKIIRDFIVEEHGSVNPYVVDTSRVVNNLPSHIIDKIRSEIELICSDLKLTDGLLHTQFITNYKELWIIEITKRCPGDLYSQLIKFSTNFPYAMAYVNPFIGKKISCISYEEKCISIIRHTLTTNSEQTFFGLSYSLALNIKRYYPLITAGDIMKPSPLSRAGIVFIEDDRTKEDIFNSIINKKAFSYEI